MKKKPYYPIVHAERIGGGRVVDVKHGFKGKEAGEGHITTWAELPPEERERMRADFRRRYGAKETGRDEPGKSKLNRAGLEKMFSSKEMKEELTRDFKAVVEANIQEYLKQVKRVAYHLVNSAWVDDDPKIFGNC